MNDVTIGDTNAANDLKEEEKEDSEKKVITLARKWPLRMLVHTMTLKLVFLTDSNHLFIYVPHCNVLWPTVS